MQGFYWVSRNVTEFRGPIRRLWLADSGLSDGYFVEVYLVLRNLTEFLGLERAFTGFRGIVPSFADLNEASISLVAFLLRIRLDSYGAVSLVETRCYRV